MFDLKKNATVDDLEDVPDDFRSIYVEREEGGYQIDPVHSKFVGAFIGAHAALDRSRRFEKDKKAELDQLKAFRQIGADPDEIRNQLSDLQEKLEGASGKKEDLERFKEEFSAKHKAILDSKDQALVGKQQELADMMKSLQGHMIGAEAARAIAAAKGDAVLLAPHIDRVTRVVRNEQGNFEVQVIDERTGEPRFDGASGQPMTIAALVQEMRRDKSFGKAFEPDGISGSGSKSNGTGGKPSRSSLGEMTSEQKIAAGLTELRRRRR